MKKNPSVDAALFPDVCLIDQIEVEEGRLHVVHTIHVRHVPKDGCFFAKPFEG